MNKNTKDFHFIVLSWSLQIIIQLQGKRYHSYITSYHTGLTMHGRVTQVGLQKTGTLKSKFFKGVWRDERYKRKYGEADKHIYMYIQVDYRNTDEVMSA